MLKLMKTNKTIFKGYQKLEWLDRDELIKRFVSVEFNRFKLL